jgi:hypothetical protein
MSFRVEVPCFSRTSRAVSDRQHGSSTWWDVRTIFDLCWIKVTTHPSQFLAFKIPQPNIALIEPSRDERNIRREGRSGGPVQNPI